MPTIIFSPLAQVQQVDDFPEDAERSIKGSLYVRPGATAVVTDAEAAHLKKSHGIVFTVIGGEEPAPKPESPVELPSPGPQQPAPGGQLFQDADGPVTGDGERRALPAFDETTERDGAPVKDDDDDDVDADEDGDYVQKN